MPARHFAKSGAKASSTREGVRKTRSNTLKARRRTVSGNVSLAVAALFACVLATGTAKAESTNGTPCTLRGVTQVAPNTAIYGADGQVIARFSGADSALSASAFPAHARGRVKVETGTGSGSFRVRGLVDVAELPVFTAQSVPVVAGHVWIAPDRRVTVVSAAPGRLKVQRLVSAPLQQTFTTWGPCSAFALGSRSSAATPTLAKGRGYVLQRPSLDLYDGNGSDGNLVMTLLRAPATDKVLFFATEQRGTWLHVEHHGEIEVDAWAKLTDLVALPPGETMDQLAPHVTVRNPARLAVQGEPRSVKTTKEVPLRRAAKEGDPVLGVIEAGTETYVLDVIAGWASVMPKALNVIPAENGQFWVKAADLGV
jgi:hypothetical protein